ncbi:ribonuclease III [Denitratisoma oestradiolicum]|uniref:Ribonuclease 3 n=1 Tax=Denitratisoma oestradiolicum TaxID=311182 RepID=A0A6S6YNM2_9PROT|nr:ribonuclease III [Denitratisoma oestradiolicum]TWO80265.1 ribonuclease III [Denitratisoma oestradiolicum]CAB1369358.1 RNase III [Denitratisoma oestradiolicum]
MKPAALQPALGYRFTRSELLVQALTHRSYGSPHNERLEFLGDSLLNCVIAALLFDAFPQLREGDLSRLRASLVRQETLAEVALCLQLGDFLRLGEGELKSGGFRRPSILADALEAIFGAIYLDSNFDGVAGVIAGLFRPLLDRVDPSDAGKDAKTALQEFLQARHLPLPRYLLRTTRGEAHAQEFEVECGIPELGIISQGSGPSRRGAEQAAARSALEMAKSK